MKKLIATIFVAIMMLVVGTTSAFAELSPTAPTTPEKPSSGSTTSPQTGDSAVVFGSLGILMAAATSVFAVKKIKE